MNFTEMLQGYTGKPLADCTNQELYPGTVGDRIRHKSASKGAACHRSGKQAAL
ncbi:MAG: hypothetical protein ACLTSZ_09705 [Lachnospiraceae bacterium]